MEHRCAIRLPADYKILIFQSGMPIAIGRIHNFSRDGLFIKTEFEDLEINQPLEIELLGRGSSRAADFYSERRVCKTFVVHKENGGIGLSLREDCAKTRGNFAAFIAHQKRRDDLGAVAARSPARAASVYPG